jgi:serine/threonine-protein kinase RsbW
MKSKATFPASKQSLGPIRDLVAGIGSEHGVSDDALYDMISAVDEAATNIIVHGYKGAPGEIEVEVALVKKQFTVTLSDRAPTFDPTLIDPPDVTLPLEKRKPGGLGVYMMKHFMDRVEHTARKGGGNVLVMGRKL